MASGWIIARVNRRSKSEELKIPAYDRLDARLARVEDKNDKLELRIDILEEDKRDDRQWIVRTISRVMSHDSGRLVALLIPWPDWYEHSDAPPFED